MLTKETADKLKEWVDKGGILVSEGCPGYFGDRVHVGTVQPNLGLDELFGVRESYVEFTPDLLTNLKFILDGIYVWGGLFLQAYEPTTGIPTGWYQDGRIAVVDNSFGNGKTRLIGTMPGAGYSEHPSVSSAGFFNRLMSFAGKQQHVKSSDFRIKARLHEGRGGTYLWVANPNRKTIPVRLELSEAFGKFSSCHSLWGAEAEVSGSTITIEAKARDVSVIKLLP